MRGLQDDKLMRSTNSQQHLVTPTAGCSFAWQIRRQSAAVDSQLLNRLASVNMQLLYTLHSKEDEVNT